MRVRLLILINFMINVNVKVRFTTEPVNTYYIDLFMKGITSIAIGKGNSKLAALKDAQNTLQRLELSIIDRISLEIN